jgi:hypothetical protein
MTGWGFGPDTSFGLSKGRWDRLCSASMFLERSRNGLSDQPLRGFGVFPIALRRAWIMRAIKCLKSIWWMPWR